MKHFLPTLPSGRNRRGFSLVESVLSVGIMSFGFLALVPLLALGLNGARLAQENRAMAQIADTLIEQAKQGTLAAGPLYFDSAGNSTTAAQAVYTVEESVTAFAPGANGGGPLTRLILRVSPRDTGVTRIYADVFSTPPTP